MQGMSSHRLQIFALPALSLLLSAPLLAQESLESQLTPGGQQAPQPPELPVEVIDPSPYLPGLPGWLILLTVVLLLAPIIAVLVVILKKNPAFTPKPSRNLLAEARQKLTRLGDLPPETPLSEVATRISLIIRQYLAESKSELALYQTHEEFLTDKKQLTSLDEPVRSKTTDYFNELQAHQYTPTRRDPELSHELIKQGVEVLNTIAFANKPQSS